MTKKKAKKTPRPPALVLNGTALALSLLFVPMSGALAGQTITIDTAVAHDVVGNSPNANGEWDFMNDVPAGLLDPNNNTVNVNANVGDSVTGGYATASSGTATANYNTITISGGNGINGGNSIYFHEVSPDNWRPSDGGVASGNSVTVINGGTAEWINGGEGYEGAIGNSVIISGGTVNEWVTGGWTPEGEATGNSVAISNGTVKGVNGAKEARPSATASPSAATL
jgi:hypothetical protein